MTAVITEPNLAEQARQAFRESVAAGQPMTGAELGSQCGRSDRWGRARIAEVRAELAAGQERVSYGAALPEWQGVEVPARSQEATPAAAVPVVPPGLTEPLTAPMAAPLAQPRTESIRPATTVVPEQPITQRPGARAVSWVAFVFGVVVSVAANVAHTLYPTEAQLTAWQRLHPGAPWHPEVGSQLAAAFWPVALLLAVEVLSRVRWRSGAWWAVARYGGTGTVALVAALMSYRHMAGLLTVYGEDTLSAHVGPLAVDGLMVVAGFALLSMGARSANTGQAR